MSSGQRRVIAYLEWAGQAVRRLSGKISETDLRTLTPQYDQLLSGFGHMTGSDTQTQQGSQRPGDDGRSQARPASARFGGGDGTLAQHKQAELGDLMIELQEVLQALRAELASAVAGAANERMQVALGPVELDLQISIQRSKVGLGGIRFYVLEGGEEPGRKEQSQSLQHINLRLQPTFVQNNGDFRVWSGDEVAGET